MVRTMACLEPCKERAQAGDREFPGFRVLEVGFLCQPGKRWNYSTRPDPPQSLQPINLKLPKAVLAQAELDDPVTDVTHTACDRCWSRGWKLLDAETSRKVRLQNYERNF
jgi:hypothetical protein